MDRALDGMAVCAGGGGLEAGIKLVLGDRYRCQIYLEREATEAGVLVKGMESGWLDKAPDWDELDTFPARRFHGLIDLISAGIPCQPFSAAGKRLAANDPRNGWPAFSRLVFDIAPSIVFMENVASADLLWYYYTEIRPCLQAMGFSVAEGIFSAEAVGAPHLRERLFWLAYRTGARRQQNTRGPSGEEARTNSSNQPEHRCEELADARHGAGSAEQRQQPQERPEVAGRGLNALADTEERGRQHVAGQRPQGRTAAGGAGEGVGHADEPRLEGCGVDGCNAHERPAFPPGPSDADGWQRWLGDWPGTEPAVRRDADGLAFRSDRLRVLGNGVVPLAAAHALLTLSAGMGVTL